jgi:hypothetical protein
VPNANLETATNKHKIQYASLLLAWGTVYIHSLSVLILYELNKFREEHGATPPKIAPAAD